jgi:hypothetical protein
MASHGGRTLGSIYVLVDRRIGHGASKLFYPQGVIALPPGMKRISGYASSFRACSTASSKSPCRFT